MLNETFSSLLSIRLAYALAKIEIADDYRERMLILVSDNLSAQFDHADTRTPFVLLPSLCCQACGEPAERTIGVSLAWFLLQVSANLLDKVEDRELTPIQSGSSDASIITNLTTGMILVAQWILNHLELDHVDGGTAWDIQRTFHETTLSVCSGQHLDLSADAPDLSTCWQIAEAKSGAAFALACYAGARLATNRSDVLDAFFSFGRELGTIVQIDDDLEDLANISEHCSSWRMKKTLVNAYLKFVESSASSTRQNDRVLSATLNSSHELISSGSVLYLQLLRLLVKQSFQFFRNIANQNFTTIFWTPNQVVFQGINTSRVATVSCVIHRTSVPLHLLFVNYPIKEGGNGLPLPPEVGSSRP